MPSFGAPKNVQKTANRVNTASFAYDLKQPTNQASPQYQLKKEFPHNAYENRYTHVWQLHTCLFPVRETSDQKFLSACPVKSTCLFLTVIQQECNVLHFEQCCSSAISIGETSQLEGTLNNGCFPKQSLREQDVKWLTRTIRYISHICSTE